MNDAIKVIELTKEEEKQLSGHDILIELIRNMDIMNSMVLIVSCFHYEMDYSLQSLEIITRFYTGMVTYKSFLFENKESSVAREICEKLLEDSDARIEQVFEHFGPTFSDKMDDLEEFLDKNETEIKEKYLQHLWNKIKRKESENAK